MKNDNIIKIAGINLDAEEVKKEFFNKDNQYIVRYKTIYQVFYSQNAGFYSNAIYYNHSNDVGYTLKGRFIWADATFINKLVGFELLHI
jgi:hypothetical protein